MENPNKEERREPGKTGVFRGFNLWLALIILAITASILFYSSSPNRSKISYSFLLSQLEGVDLNGNPILDDEGEPVGCNIEFIEIGELQTKGGFKIEPNSPTTFNFMGKETQPSKKKLYKLFYVDLPQTHRAQHAHLSTVLAAKGIEERHEPPTNALSWVSTLLILFMVGILVMMFISYRRSQSQMMGGGGFLSGFSKSPAKLYEGENQGVTFADVAGLEGVKADLLEIVDYLKDPAKFQKLGGRVPKGVLLNGPPGTGKTLLARAVAGEANVPFYSVNGSEFIQMFVGVGASRVRDLFKTAKEHNPSIIFIDEIDAVGRQRGAGLGGGHDEREQTLNQILGEMDGFQGNDSVIVVAATNRPDVLDPALLRPGRFDRHVTVSRPTLSGRLAILKVHSRDVPLDANVDLGVVAAGSVGMTGADLRNVVNEAALWAARNDKSVVEMNDFEYARDKILMGAKREEVLSDLEKERTAYHEAGHTIAAWFSKGAHPVHKVTIIPRGQALGVTQMIPGEDRMNNSESEIRDHLIVLLGGRAAEKIIYDEVTVGAENDLERATGLARRMITQWGMSKRLGPVSYKLSDEDPFLGREIHQQRQFSEHTLEVIDEEVTKILHDASEAALKMLEGRREHLENLTKKLVEMEELDSEQIESVLGESVHPKRPTTATPSKEVAKEEPNEELVEDLKQSEGPTDVS